MDFGDLCWLSSFFWDERVCIFQLSGFYCRAADVPLSGALWCLIRWYVGHLKVYCRGPYIITRIMVPYSGSSHSIRYLKHASK